MGNMRYLNVLKDEIVKWVDVNHIYKLDNKYYMGLGIVGLTPDMDEEIEDDNSYIDTNYNLILEYL